MPTRKSARSLAAVALLGLTALPAVLTTGCADENDPATWVKRLDDPAKRVAAVTRLVQFFEDAMTNDKGNREGPKVKPVLDKITDPLNAQCVKGDLDDKSQAKIVKFLSDARDARGEPCLLKILKDYKLGSGEENVRWATRAVTATKMKSAAGPLYEVFTKIKASHEKVGNVYRDVSDAMMALQDPSWEANLITNLQKPIKTPDPKNKQDLSDAKDQVFWQVTSAVLLGNMKSAKAVDPLMRVLLTPSKGVVAVDAMNSLIKIGKPASDAAGALLKGENADLAKYASDELLKGAAKPDDKLKKAAKTAYVEKAAFIMATIGREDAVAVLLGAMEKAKADAAAGKGAAPAPKGPPPKKGEEKPSEDESASALAARAAISRVLIARELAQVPKSPEVIKAFQTTLDETPINLAMPVGATAREALLEKAPDFFDATFVPFLVKEALEAKPPAGGDDGDLVGMREKTLEILLKLAKADQVGDLDKLYNMKVKGPDNKDTTFGKAFEKEYKAMTELLKECTDKGECYLNKLLDPKNHSEKASFVGVKAAYMVAILDYKDAKSKLVDGIAKAANEQQRYMCLKLIDHFSPKGDKAIADQLQKMDDAARESKDEGRIASMRNVRTILYRLNARAQ